MQLRILLIFLSLFAFALPLQAQQKKKPVETPRPAPSRTKPQAAEPSRPAVNTEANMLVLKIDPTLNCLIYVDGEEKGKAKVGEFKKLPLPKGEFILKFVSEDGLDSYEIKYNVYRDDLNTQKFFPVDLLNRRKDRMEREAKEKADNDFNTALKNSRDQQSAGNFEAAQAAAQRALDLKPGDYNATEQLKNVRNAWYRHAMDQGDTYLQKGQYSKAVSAYESVLDLAPDKEKVRKQIIEAKNRPGYNREIEAGDSLLLLQQFEAAKNAYRRAETLTEAKSAARKKIEDTDVLAEKKRIEDERKHREMLARQAREEFEGYLNDIKKDMAMISGGTFVFGCQSDKDDGCLEVDPKPRNTEVADFYLAKRELTNRQFVRFLDSIAADIRIDDKGDAILYQGEKIYSLFCGETKGACPGYIDGIQYDGGKQPGGHFSVTPGMENKPVLMVTYQGAQAYCRWLSQSSGLQYRLPTEAEWEYAARGGNQARENAAQSSLTATAWYKDNSNGAIKDTGLKMANALGLYDMRGNAMEFCSSSTGNNSVAKGGSYKAAPEQCSPGRRFNFSPANATGFRLAMTPKY